MRNLLALLILVTITFQTATALVKPSGKTYPKISVQDNGRNFPLKLQELYIQVEITGNIAVTNWQMVFINTENRILEGELEFPLGEGQTVSRFAMDIKGKKL